MAIFFLVFIVLGLPISVLAAYHYLTYRARHTIVPAKRGGFSIQPAKKEETKSSFFVQNIAGEREKEERGPSCQKNSTCAELGVELQKNNGGADADGESSEKRAPSLCSDTNADATSVTIGRLVPGRGGRIAPLSVSIFALPLAASTQPPPLGRKVARALFSFFGEDKDDLSFRKGDLIILSGASFDVFVCNNNRSGIPA